MPQVVSCPSCRRELKLPDALAGKSVRCPQCNTQFTSPPLSSPCPICKGLIPEGALACGDCGYAFHDTTRIDLEERPNVCPKPECGTLNPPGERLCQRCNTPLPGAIGHVIAGQYRIERHLADGGFGVVYKAQDIRDGKEVAVKEMIAVDGKEQAMRQKFFRREVEVLRALQSSPIVPRVYDYIEDGSNAYLMLEFIPGNNLLALLDQPGAQPFPVAKAAQWGIKLCDALTRMHRMTPPIIHRDMKPENVMLLPDGETIRLIDFGTARELGRGPKERGVAKTKVYTEGYAPPEQIIGKAEPRSDLFALAGTLYHLVTGQAPEGFFTGREVIKKLSQYRPDEQWFYELIALNLAEDMNDRYLSAQDMKSDLERHVVTKNIVCASCFAPTSSREPYCRQCATPLTEAGYACAHCERTNLLGCRFCIGCGARL
jgi:LSD1 subclass zinc finger protein